MNKACFIYVGRLKTSFWQSAAEHYRSRLSKSWQIKEVMVKDADPSLPVEVRKKQEGERILASVPAGYTLICLDEHGQMMDSPGFSRYLSGLWDNSRPPCLVIGGAFGLSSEVLQRASKIISFSVMTFTHEMAQVILWEQLFRADSIIRKTGYHH